MKVKTRMVKGVSITPECLENFSKVIKTDNEVWVALRIYPNPRRQFIVPIEYLRLFYHDVLPERFIQMITGVQYHAECS